MRLLSLGYLSLIFTPISCAVPAYADLVARTPSRLARPQAEGEQLLRRALFGRRGDEGSLQSYDSGILSLDRSWEDSTLLKLDFPNEREPGSNGTIETSVGLEISCQQCYVKGDARVTLTFEEPFNHTAYIEDIKGEIQNFTSEVIDAAENITQALLSGDFDLSDVKVEFTDIDIPDPKATLRIGLDGVDIYALLNAKLSAGATYTKNLLHTNTEFGLSANSDLWLGAVIFVDLVLSAEAEINLESGFHIEFDDEIVIDIPMFDENITNIAFNGGQIEFLPVKFKGAGAALKAALQVSARVGFNIDQSLDTPSSVDTVCEAFGNDTCPDFSFSTGVEVAVYATLFESETVLNADLEDENCALNINQTFQFAVGAIAGASVAVDDLTLGPELETSTAIFTATFGTCAVSAAAATTTPASQTITARGEIAKRETTVLSTEVAVTAVGCESAGLLNCPVSLQTMTVYTSTLSLTTDIKDGDQEPTFPASTQNTIVTAIPFGSHAKRLPSTTGLPKAFTAQPSSDPDNPFGNGDDGSTGSLGNDGDGKGHKDNKNPIIIGVTVGLGVPILAGLVGIFIFLRRRYAQRSMQDGVLAETYSPVAQTDVVGDARGAGRDSNAKKTAQAIITEARDWGTR